MPSDAEKRAFLVLWEHVRENWEDTAIHTALLVSSDEQGTLALAARRYRIETLSDDEEHVAIAEEQLKKITALAFAQLEFSRGEAPKGNRLMTLSAFVVSALLIGASAYLLTR